MIRATTPTIIMTLPDEVDLTTVDKLVFTLKQGSNEINKYNQDISIDGQKVSVWLSQQETLNLEEGVAKMQLNWTYNDGSRAASNIVLIDVTPNLLAEVIT